MLFTHTVMLLNGSMPLFGRFGLEFWKEEKINKNNGKTAGEKSKKSQCVCVE